MNVEQRETVDTARLATELERRLARLWSAVLRPSSQELSRTATSVLARLRDGGPQRGGLVERRPDAADAGAVLVAVTEEGRAALARPRERRTAVLGARLEGL